jgi:predicted alpha/beta-hydrolase family hydrolase
MRFGILVSLVGCLLATAASGAEPAAKALTLTVRGQTCSALLLRPADARALLVLAHGQVMDMHHPFMEGISAALARRGVATLRFNFPYAEAKRTRPDGMPLLIETLETATRAGEQQRGELPLLAGGKSAGAMMAVQAARDGRLSVAQGIVILGYPLHAPGRPSGVNARPLEGVSQPMLLVQGTRDPLADLTLVRGLVEKLGPSARLHLVQGADHAFALPEGDRRTPEEIYDEIAGAVARFAATLAASPGG